LCPISFIIEKSLQRAFAVICKSSSVIAKWRQLLHHLCQDDDNHVIDVTKEIDDKYPDETTKCQNALLHWKSTTTAPSVWKLVDALRANRCTIVAGKGLLLMEIYLITSLSTTVLPYYLS
jgi:hypothetical protein